MLVSLTWREVRLAAFAGIDTNIMDIYKGFRDRYGASTDENGWQKHIVGAIGEFAVAKALNQYWPGADMELAARGDVSRLQVRSTTRRDGRLIVNRTDRDDAAFILVTGVPPKLTIPGWIEGAAGKNEAWWQTYNGRSAFFVPQSALQPLGSLVATV
jgi:hypothetical protein